MITLTVITLSGLHLTSKQNTHLVFKHTNRDDH
jgi:hypothetical protein